MWEDEIDRINHKLDMLSLNIGKLHRELITGKPSDPEWKSLKEICDRTSEPAEIKIKLTQIDDLLIVSDGNNRFGIPLDTMDSKNMIRINWWLRNDPEASDFMRSNHLTACELCTLIEGELKEIQEETIHQSVINIGNEIAVSEKELEPVVIFRSKPIRGVVLELWSMR